MNVKRRRVTLRNNIAACQVEPDRVGPVAADDRQLRSVVSKAGSQVPRLVAAIADARGAGVIGLHRAEPVTTADQGVVEARTRAVVL